MISVLFSSYKRFNLFQNTMDALAKSLEMLKFPYEVIIADEISDESEKIFNYARKTFNAGVFVSVDMELFYAKTRVKKYHNNPSLCNNIAFRYSQYDTVALQGNDILVNPETYPMMWLDRPATPNYIVYATTYALNEHGNVQHIMQSPNVHADVTNYLSFCSRRTWDGIGGYDELFMAGVACEDSDFSRRARLLPNFTRVMSQAETFHQFHGTLTSSIKSDSPIKAGNDINKNYYKRWYDKQYITNPQPWVWGVYGVTNVQRWNKCK